MKNLETTTNYLVPTKCIIKTKELSEHIIIATMYKYIRNP
jgi:hypothetical protein